MIVSLWTWNLRSKVIHKDTKADSMENILVNTFLLLNHEEMLLKFRIKTLYRKD